jgi:hypothetical protein
MLQKGYSGHPVTTHGPSEVHFNIKPQNSLLCSQNSSYFKKGIVDIRSQHTVHPKGVHAHGTDKGVDLNLGKQIIS